MQFLDTNVFLRYLTRDDEAKASRCFVLFQQLQSGAAEATTSEVIIAEVVYVLSARNHYHLTPIEIRDRLLPMINVKGLKLPSKRRVLRALGLSAAYPFLDFEDALTVAAMEQDGIRELLSYDRNFDRIPGITRVEP
jgi:predicted nucleic acid-binding protein